MRTLVKNIAKLVGIETAGRLRMCGEEMDQLEIIEDAWLLIDGNRFAAFGYMESLGDIAVDEVVDAAGGYLFPSFCDSHTHLVYAGSGEAEFTHQIHDSELNESCHREEILSSAALLHETSEEDLFEQAMTRIREIANKGTGCVEIKSGYALSLDDELKMLRVIRRLDEASPMTVRSSFFGAHLVPPEYMGRQSDYVDAVCNEMMPVIAENRMADFVDVFCDEGYFSPEETERVLKAGRKLGLQGKIHTNKRSVSGGVQVGAAGLALSVDHLEQSGDAEIEALRGTMTMPTLLPGTDLFLGLNYPPARKMIQEGLSVALASNYNPGSSPSGDMRLVMAVSCIKMRMTAKEALNAVTLNGAYAMGLSRNYGSITIGKTANFFITKPIPSIDFFTYACTTPLIEKVFLQGKIFV